MPWFGMKKSSLPPATDLQAQKVKQIETLRGGGSLQVTETIRDVEYRVVFQIAGSNLTLVVSLPPQFPRDKPIVTVEPRVIHPWVDQQGKVIGCSNLNNFSIYSSLVVAIQAIIEEFKTNPPSLSSHVYYENENTTTLNGNNGQQQPVPKSDRFHFQEQDLSDTIPKITEDVEWRMKRINELDTLRGQLKALDEEKKKLQDELSNKEITILQLHDALERRLERPKSAYPTDHHDKGRPERPKSAYPIDHRFQRHSQEEMQRKIDEQQSVIDTLTTLKTQKNEECERHCNEIDILKGKLKHYEHLITSLKEEKLNNEKMIIGLTDENNELLNRLSKSASDRTTHTNTDIPDLSDETRPSKLTKKMSDLYDYQWTSAFDELKTNGFEDENAIGILLNIVMETNQVCKMVSFSHYQKIKETCTCLEYSASAYAENIEQGKIIMTGNINIEMQQGITSIWRESSKKVLNQVIPIIREKVAEKFEIALLQMTQIELYMDECAELCWMMNIQEKPMHLDINVPEKDGHAYFDTEMFISYTKTGRHVAFVVWPALYLFEGGSLLKKGIAQGCNGWEG